MRITDPIPDYLGPTYQARIMYLDQTDGGSPAGQADIAVLVYEKDAASLVAESGVAALYLPGFSDTFYQTEQSEAWRSLSIPLVALEMRRDGRALRLESSRGDIRDLRVRSEEIGYAVDFLRKELGAQRIVLIGHSLGSLNAQLWAKRHPDQVDLMIHISPWVEHRASAFERAVMTRANDTVGRIAPRTVLGFFPPYYARSLHVEYGGEFYFSPRHKPLKATPLLAGMFRSIRIAQRAIQSGDLQLDIPTLVAASDRSGASLVPGPDDLARTDCVLDVEDIKVWAPMLSTSLRFLEVPGARHDVTVSRKPVRKFYTRSMLDWVKSQLGLPDPEPES